MTATLQRHSLSALFLNLPEAELAKMADDIKAHGLVEPIVTIEENGERFVLDGWSRYQCCLKAGVEPRFVDFADMKTGLTPAEFAMSRNMFRKHLTATQRACIAAEIFEQRFLKPGMRPGEGSAPASSVSLAEVAKVARVDRTTLRAVRTIQRASPETFSKMKRGEGKDAYSVVRADPNMRVGKKHSLSPGVAASRALSPMLCGVRDLVEGLKLKPAEFAKQWAIWEGHDKAQRLKAMKTARQWLDEAIAAVEAQAAIKTASDR